MQAPPRLNDAGACIGNACIYNACICYPLLRRSAESSPSERGFSPARLALITCALPTDADAAAPRAAEAAAELISTIPVPRTSPTARAGAPRLRRIAGRAAGPGRYGIPSAGQRRWRRRRAPGRLCPQSLTAPMTSLLVSPRPEPAARDMLIRWARWIKYGKAWDEAEASHTGVYVSCYIIYIYI